MLSLSGVEDGPLCEKLPKKKKKPNKSTQKKEKNKTL